ncbi:MAG TPA: hypothetical protein VKC34_00150, partial [Blastocatellia bacterium]|nr:hypothetical protein [Blastocatellia bacterium]
DELGPVITSGDDKTGSNSIRACDLSRFDTIIIDSRALAAHPRLASASQCLTGYSGRGGNLVILAQDAPAWNSLAVSRQLSPHAIKLSPERLGPEPGAFKIIEPEHALLLQPNKITEKDFENWTGVRATAMPGEWAAEYHALLEWTGADGKAEKGALLVAQSGEGSVIYTSLDLKAQVLALNPAAFRIFSNIVGYRK